MGWTSPTYAEIKMDAEIGSYQEDDEDRAVKVAATDSADEAPSAA
jgi:hypothetical protein